MNDLVRKDTIRASAGDDQLEYVMSDDSIDRFGEVIDQTGWTLSQFKRNPVALFGHDATQPIGSWTNVRVEGNQLRGHLNLLERGLSQRVDELHALIDAGILRAVSVGFRPIKQEPMNSEEPWGPSRYLKSELVECSIVSIPANPNALAVAKSLNISSDTRSLIFGEPAEIVRRDGKPGEPAVPVIRAKGKAMTLAEKIAAAEASVNSLTDQLASHVLKDGDDEVLTRETEELSDRLEASKRSLAALKKAETQMASSSVAVRHTPTPTAQPSGVPVSGRVYAGIDTKMVKRAGDHVFRALTCQLLSHISKETHYVNPTEMMVRHYGEDRATKEVMDVITRAASAPATTTTSGWASQLVATAIVDFIDQLQPLSVYPSLAAKGPRFSFGRSGVISIPARAATPTVGGGFIAEGAPIPVKQGAFSAATITPRKLGVITTFTREIGLYSTPDIESLLRSMILDDTATAIDSVLLSASAGTTTAPPGLRNGVSGQTPTSGGGFNALVGDVKNLVGVLVAANSLRAPVWIMNPAEALSISLTQNAGGDFPFKAEINGGAFMGFPVILSTTQTAKTVILLDAADFFSATSDSPVFAVSDTATLHMEDTTPLAIGTVGSPNTVAAPTRSLFQTDTLAIRMTMDANWAMRRTGVIAWVAAVTW